MRRVAGTGSEWAKGTCLKSSSDVTKTNWPEQFLLGIPANWSRCESRVRGPVPCVLLENRVPLCVRLQHYKKKMLKAGELLIHTADRESTIFTGENWKDGRKNGV